MRCYQVLVHGKLEWRVPSSTPDETQPRGLYCTRHVLARSELQAAQKACANVTRALDRKLSGAARSTCVADDIAPAQLWKLLARNPGLVFYNDE